MEPRVLFAIFNFGVLPFWALLVLAPRWAWTRRLIHSGLAPAALAVAHLVGVLVMSPAEGAGGHSLHAAMRLFDREGSSVVCWVHYLAFDLFVGAWIARDAARRGLPHLAVAPTLLVTLFFGPPGLLLYVALRAALRRAVSLEEMPVATGASTSNATS